MEALLIGVVEILAKRQPLPVNTGEYKLRAAKRKTICK
jgi:hypothetical protein